jgi:hypothetical protein
VIIGQSSKVEHAQVSMGTQSPVQQPAETEGTLPIVQRGGMPSQATRSGSHDTGHSPVVSTETLARAASHAFEYVVPSQPQTGTYSRVQVAGMGVQTPGPSARPQMEDGGKLQ